MASMRYRPICFALLAICLLQAEGKVSQQPPTIDTAVESSESGVKVTAEDDPLAFIALGQPNKNNLIDVPFWPYIMMAIIQMFYRQRADNRSQFGVLFMGNVDNLNDFQLNVYPHDTHGNPVIDNRYALSPARQVDFGNYVTSRPENVQHTMIHAENRMLQEIDTLWNAYRERYGRTPNFMLLYSWIMPCPDCTALIINNFNREPYANVQYRIVAYTVEGTNSGLTYMTPTGNQHSRLLLTNNNITVYRQRCDRPGDSFAFDLENSNRGNVFEESVMGDGNVQLGPDTHTCKLDDTFQGCMTGCINVDLCCSCKDSGKKSMVVALVNQLTKDCATSDITKCAGKWVLKAIQPNGGKRASACITPDSVSNNVQQCASKCAGRPLAKPLDPKKPSYYPGYLKRFADLFKLPKTDLTDFCKDIRTEGIFCTSYRSDSFTAGNTLCRSDNRCGYHGYKYSWCYVDWSKRWDYCCTGSCGFNDGTNYQWCKSGDKWQYCGAGGDVDIQARRCVAEYPCGVHQEVGKASYYWCYTDLNKNWDRCCQPWHKCAKHGESYNWGYTGYKRNSEWKKCKP